MVLALLGLSVFLFLYRPAAHPVKVELLPFTDSPPAWDGSYPYLVISLVSSSNPVKFSATISLRKPTVRHESPANEFAVDLHTGRFVLRQTDFFVRDAMPLSLTRTYIAWDFHSRAFGVGTSHPYDVCPTGTRYPYTYMDLNLEDFYQVHMPRISKGTGYADAVFRHSETSSEFYGSQVAWNGKGWTLSLLDGTRFYFPEAYHAKSYAQGAAIAIEDARGHRVQLKRGKARNLEQLISPSGNSINFKYDTADRIVEAQDDAGHVRHYSYNSSGHLETVSDESGALYRFEYAPLMNDAGFDAWLMTRILDGRGRILLRNTYLWGRVSEQWLANGEIYRYRYRLAGSDVMQTSITLPTGEQRSLSFGDGKLIDRK
ncbi:MAG: hypothetical protein JWQ87_1667 [Candidatus Sulfotelmatobacter sp.]|nr:hypothetical protein [Candidatus Sulfotelmatobacter sp.]